MIKLHVVTLQKLNFRLWSIWSGVIVVATRFLGVVRKRSNFQQDAIVPRSFTFWYTGVQVHRWQYNPDDCVYKLGSYVDKHTLVLEAPNFCMLICLPVYIAHCVLCTSLIKLRSSPSQRDRMRLHACKTSHCMQIFQWLRVKTVRNRFSRLPPLDCLRQCLLSLCLWLSFQY